MVFLFYFIRKKKQNPNTVNHAKNAGFRISLQWSGKIHDLEPFKELFTDTKSM